MVTYTGSVSYDTRGTVDTTKLTTIVQTKKERPELSLPMAQIGQIVPYVIGRFRITTPNFIWYGNVKNIIKVTKKERVETKEKDLQVRSIFWTPGEEYPDDALPADSDLAKIARENLEIPMLLTSVKVYETETIVTYEREVVGYTVDAAIGICLGPNVELLGIYEGNKRIWQGSATGRTEVAGDGKDESLLKNGFIYRDGGFSQTPEPYLAGIPGGPANGDNLPGYVGIAYIVLKTVNSALLSGADLQFEVRRLPNPLGLATNVNVIAGNDINPSTAVADILLNEWGGVGIDPAWIDVANFTAAAARFATEGLGMSLAIAQENYGVALVNEMQEQTRSIVYADPETSLIRIKPLRPDVYDENALLEITPSEASSYQSFAKTAFLAMPTHFAIKYYNRSRNYEQTVVTNRNPAVPPMTSRAKRLASIDFGAVCTDAIAEASFDLLLSSISVPRISSTIVTDRNAADLVPGDLFLVTWPLYSMEKFPVYVTKVREQEIETNSVLIECDQYLRPNVKKFFKAAEPSKHTVPDLVAYKPTNGAVLDAPWWILQRKGFNGNPDTAMDVTYPMFFAAGANDSQLYFDVHNRANDAALLEAEPFPLNARLVGNLSRLDGHLNWVIDNVTLRQVINPDFLANIGLDGVTEGTRLMFINDEIFSFESFTANPDGTYTLHNVHRGLIDTVAQNHADNDAVYIVDLDALSLSDKGHTAVSSPYNYSLTSRAMRNAGKYPADSFNLPSYFPYGRPDGPVRPQGVTINFSRLDTPTDLILGAETSVQWNTRSRMDKKIATMNVPPQNAEIMSKKRFQAHMITLIDSAADEYVVGNSLTGDTDGLYPAGFSDHDITFNIPAAAALGAGKLRVECVLMTYDKSTPAVPPVYQFSAYQWEELDVFIRPAGWIMTEYHFNYGVG